MAVGLTLCGCEAPPIRIVECTADTLCGANEVCGPDRRCVPQTLLTWDERGWVGSKSNAFGIQGGWYRYDDCEAVAQAIAAGTFECPDDALTPNCCTAWDPALQGYDELPGWSITAGTPGVSSGRACFAGTVPEQLAEVGPDGLSEFTPQFGLGVGLALNDQLAFDATREFEGGPIVGVELDLEGPPSEHPVRVGFGVADSYEKYASWSFVPTPKVQVLFGEVVLGEWVQPQVPLDRSQITEVAITAPIALSTSIAINFCVTNLRVLQGPAP